MLQGAKAQKGARLPVDRSKRGANLNARLGIGLDPPRVQVMLIQGSLAYKQFGLGTRS